ncbi:hypothetical protein MMC30_001343 [Trapelia coarctata]|nr:hypothetical protein [Trapelia coarctata]
MQPRWPDPPTQLSSGLRESIQLNNELVHVLELASANLAYSYSKAATGSLDREGLNEETNKHHAFMKLWDQRIEELRGMHSRGHGHIEKALAALGQVRQEQTLTSETNTQIHLLKERLHETLALFKPPQYPNANLEGRRMQGGAVQNLGIGDRPTGTISAPIDLTQRAVADEQVRPKNASNPTAPSMSFCVKPIPQDPATAKQSPVPPPASGFSGFQIPNPFSSGQKLQTDASHSAADKQSAKPLSSTLFGPLPNLNSTPTPLGSSAGLFSTQPAQHNAGNPFIGNLTAEPFNLSSSAGTPNPNLTPFYFGATKTSVDKQAATSSVSNLFGNTETPKPNPGLFSFSTTNPSVDKQVATSSVSNLFGNTETPKPNPGLFSFSTTNPSVDKQPANPPPSAPFSTLGASRYGSGSFALSFDRETEEVYRGMWLRKRRTWLLAEASHRKISKATATHLADKFEQRVLECMKDEEALLEIFDGTDIAAATPLVTQ